jgi:hypothetical protein
MVFVSAKVEVRPQVEIPEPSLDEQVTVEFPPRPFVARIVGTTPDQAAPLESFSVRVTVLELLPSATVGVVATSEELAPPITFNPLT